jgi:signal transduction histidine kinase
VVGRTWTLSRPRIDTPRLGEIRRIFPALVFSSEGVPRQILLSLLVAVGYYLGTRIGFYLTPHEVAISTFWPPNAVLLAALLLAPRSMWWMFLLAVFPAHLLIQLRIGVPLSTACGWFVSNSAEALLGAACIRHFKKADELFENVPGVLTFLAFGVVLAPLASSFVDAGVVVTTAFGSGYWKLWTARLFSNMLADLTVAPTIIVLAVNRRSWVQQITPSRILEGILLGSAIVGVSIAVFGIRDPTIPAIMFSPLPLVVWIVVRFGVGGLYPSLLAISLISIWNATRGWDPFVLAPMAESIRGIQVFLSTITLPMMLLAAVLAERKAVEASLRQSRAQLIQAQEQERRRIARELHDDIGQQLTLLELELDQLKQRSGEVLMPSLDKLHRQASAAAAAARTISHGLHSAHLEFLGLVPALRNLCETVTHETSIEVAFTEQNVPAHVDPQISLCLYRVTQEALHNIARHSHAHKASVQIHGNSKRISLQIVDDGIGIAGESGHAAALGLASMRERVSLTGGTFKLVSQPMRGTRIEATVPLSGTPS